MKFTTRMRRLFIVIVLTLPVFTFSQSATLTPASSFGTQIQNTTSAGQVLTLQNTTSNWLSISGPTLSGSYPSQFSDSPTTCGASLGPNMSCTVTIKFSPTYLGPKTATVGFTITAGGTGSPSSNLFGIGSVSSMVLYQNNNDQATPQRQINVFSGTPFNADMTDYSHLTSILNPSNLNTYITGVTSSLPLGCTAAPCTGAAGTYLDQANNTGMAGGVCPNLVFSDIPDAIDTFVNTVAAAKYINNLILVNASYGGDRKSVV